MRRLRALLGKELRQHALLFGGLVLIVLPIQGLVLLGLAVAPQTLTVYEAHALYLRLFVPLFGVVLGNRLIVAEYQQRTQLFLQGLPLRRVEMVTLKWVVGFLVLVALTLLGFAVTSMVAAVKEPVTGGFVALILVRSVAWVAVLWGFMFAMGFTGRFRIGIYLALALLLLAVTELSDFELSRFGPFALVDQTLVLERETLDASSVLVSLAIGLGCSLLGFALALAGEGTLAEALARRMSTREKSAVGAFVLIGLVVISTLDAEAEPEPFRFPDQTPVARAASLPIEVAYGAEDRREAADRLVDELRSTLDGLAERLGWERLPPVRVSWSGALDGRTFEPVILAPGDGILVRAAFDDPELDAIGLRSAVVRALLAAQTEQRADFEPYAFFADGYARHVAEATSAERTGLLRALYATRHDPVDGVDVRRWLQTRERLGPPVAEGLASSAVDALAAAGGEGAPDRVARSLFATAPPEDARAAMERLRAPPHEVLADAAGLESFDAFVETWNAHLDRLRREPWAAVLVDEPTVDGRIDVRVVEGDLRAVVATLQGPPPDRDVAVTLLHHRLTPFDDRLPDHELERLESRWPAGVPETSQELSGRYGPGERAFVAVEVRSSVLGCPLRLVAERRTIR